MSHSQALLPTKLEEVDEAKSQPVNPELTQWMQEHKGNYFSYAIDPSNLDQVFKTAVIMPPELELRKNLKVTVGDLDDFKETIDISAIVDDFKKLNIKLPKAVELVDEMRLFNGLEPGAVSLGIITNNQYNEIFENRNYSKGFSVTLRDGKQYQIDYKGGGITDAVIKGVPYLNLSGILKCHDALRELCKKYNSCDLIKMPDAPDEKIFSSPVIPSNAAYIRTRDALYYIHKTNKVSQKLVLSKDLLSQFDTKLKPDTQPKKLSYSELYDISKLTKHNPINIFERPFQLANDILSDQPIDKDLAVVWKAIDNLSFMNVPIVRAKMRGELYANLVGRRENEIMCWPSLPNHLSVRWNAVAVTWNKGNVVVLRGNPKETLSDYQEQPFKTGHFVELKAPLENNGEFYSLDLDQKDTIMIGPRDRLKPHVTQEHRAIKESIPQEIFPPVLSGIVADYARKIKIFYIEDMSQDQLTFFKLPAQPEQVKQPQANALDEKSQEGLFSKTPKKTLDQLLPKLATPKGGNRFSFR